MPGRDQNAVGKTVKPKEIPFQQRLYGLKIEITQIFAIIGMTAHYQGKVTGNSVTHTPEADSQFGTYMNQVWLKVIADFIDFPESRKSQTAPRG
jgi:hypothetical protein